MGKFIIFKPATQNPHDPKDDRVTEAGKFAASFWDGVSFSQFSEDTKQYLSKEEAYKEVETKIGSKKSVYCSVISLGKKNFKTFWKIVPDRKGIGFTSDIFYGPPSFSGGYFRSRPEALRQQINFCDHAIRACEDELSKVVECYVSNLHSKKQLLEAQKKWKELPVKHPGLHFYQTISRAVASKHHDIASISHRGN